MMTHLHVFLTRGTHESRFLREADAALRHGVAERVVLAGIWDHGLPEQETLRPGVEVVRIRLRSHRLPKGLPWHALRGLEWRARVVELGARLRPTLVQAHSLYALAPATALRRRLRIPLVYDAHELETERNGLRGMRQRIERRLERRLIGRCDAVLCVSDAIADWYAQRYSIGRPAVVRNIPDAVDVPSPERSPLRERLGLRPTDMIFLYQGGLSRGRRIEQLLEAFREIRAPRHLVFMGYGELEGVVRAAAERQPNIHFLPAVSPARVLEHSAGADVGLCGVEAVCLSYYLALPNKLFEYLHAGLAVLAPDYPEMRAVVKSTECGWVVGERTEDWRDLILSLRPEALTSARARAREARALYSWSREAERLVDVYRSCAP